MNDQDLVAEILKGNMDSFSILVNKYELSIFKFIYNIIRNKEASEDLTQEVFITLFNKLYTYNMQYKFSNWLYQIARNKTIDYIRKYKRVYEANIEEYANVTSYDISPEEALECRELKDLIKNYIGRLSPEDKEILFLRYSNEEMTFKDIGEVLNITESSAKRKFYKIRDKFRSQRSIMKEGVDYD